MRGGGRVNFKFFFQDNLDLRDVIFIVLDLMSLPYANRFTEQAVMLDKFIFGVLLINTS